MLFVVVGLPVLTGTASYTNRLEVLLASMAQNESVDILSLICKWLRARSPCMLFIIT